MNFTEAYRCTCGHTMKKYLGSTIHIYERLAFISCCPKCGGSRHKIKTVTGKWGKRKSQRGIWPFTYTETIQERFVEK